MYKKESEIDAFSLAVLSFLLLMLTYFPVISPTLDYFHADDSRLFAQLAIVYRDGTFFNFIFDPAFFKFRPIANAQYLLEYAIFGGNLSLWILYNILLLSFACYLFIKLLEKRIAIFPLLLLLLLFIFSKFITYACWNLTGSFEALGLVLFLSILSVFGMENLKLRSYLFIFLSLALILTSERYLPFVVLVPLLLYLSDSLIRRKQFFTYVAISCTVVVAYLFMRYMLSVPLIVGTQTDNVLESFNFARLCFHFAKALGEMFGFNFGPTYLTGYEFPLWVPVGQWSRGAHSMLGLSVLAVISNLWLYFKAATKAKSYYLNAALIVLAFAASVTFRLEIRWLAPCYVALLLMIASNYNVDVKANNLLLCFALLPSVALSLIYTLTLRGNLYFAGKLHSTSLSTLLIN